MTTLKDENRAILVTGGAGNIGSQFVRDLARNPYFADYAIRIYDSLQRQRFDGLIDLPVDGRCEFIEGDILDQLNLKRAMSGADIVVHLAAIVITPLSFDHPDWTNQVNHWGTAAVVNCALSTNVSRFIYAGSSSFYGPGGPFQEPDPCRPIWPYALSKYQAEREVLQGAERGLNITIVRLGTAFGNAPACVLMQLLTVLLIWRVLDSLLSFMEVVTNFVPWSIFEMLQQFCSYV